ncbi:hypothetical protein [Streptomyces huasconensis]|uniref:hypothetical protein n=1 Tax=Streptomyces huasconensis TaxID=1854574 RepID=UPI003700DCA7
MIIVYTPAGGEAEQYDAKTLRVSEVSIVQRTIDMKWGEIKEGLGVEDLDAMRGIVWVLKKRSTPSLRWNDFDPGVTEMVTRMDRDETRDYINNAVQIMTEDPEVSREAVMAALGEVPSACIDPEYAEAQIAAVADGPKEAPAEQVTPEAPTSPQPSPSPTSASPETSTSDSSPTSSTSHLQPSTT